MATFGPWIDKIILLPKKIILPTTGAVKSDRSLKIPKTKNPKPLASYFFEVIPMQKWTGNKLE